MAIENNYGGPPSLEIYQEFVRSSGSASVDQNAVVVAPHYEVVKAGDVTAERMHEYSYGTKFEYTFDSIKSQYKVTSEYAGAIDKGSVKVVFPEAWVAQHEEGIEVEDSDTGYELILDNDIYNGYPDKLSAGVFVGEKVLVECGSSFVVADIVAIKESGTKEMTGEGTKYFDLDEGAEEGVYYVTKNDTAINVVAANGSTGCSAAIKDSVSSVDDGTYEIIVSDSGLRKVVHVDADVTGATKVYFGKLATNIVVKPVVSDETVSITDAEVHGRKVIAGTCVIEFRALSSKFNGNLGYITSADISKVGYTGVENPLGAMVKTALKGGRGVYCVGVESDSVTAYRKAFVLLSRSTNTYGVVIHSLREDVIAEAHAFVKGQADPSVANYKILYYGLNDSNDKALIARANGVRTVAEVSKGGVLTFVKDNATQGFYATDVQAGDVVRINYRTGEFGTELYDEYTVQSVTDDTHLVLNVPTKFSAITARGFEVHRTLEGSELVDELKKRVYTASHRCYCVFGDGIEIDGVVDAPAWLKAALPAGMRAGEYCQRPISNMVYSGCSATNKYQLDAAQLRSLASRGVWILANDADGFTVYNYHQLSTDMSDKKHQEQSYTTNFDNISRRARSLMSPYYGNSNISEEFLDQLLAHLVALLGGMTMNAPSVEVGPQLISYENLTLTQDPVHRDHVYMEVDYNMPAPFNHITMRQRLI